MANLSAHPDRDSAPPQDAIVEFRAVSKSYRCGRVAVCALADFTLRVEKGETVALIGANGAGKTTALRCLLGLSRPTDGTIRVGGATVEFGEKRTGLGYLPERFSPPGQLTGREFLCGLAKLAGAAGKDRIDEAIGRVGLERAADRRIGGYSKGMMQRIGLACLLLAPRDCLVLDEPSSGLDPVGRREVRDILAELKRAGQTMIVSTHALADAEAIADRVALLAEGGARYLGPVRGLIEKHGASTLEEAFLADRALPRASCDPSAPSAKAGR